MLISMSEELSSRKKQKCFEELMKADHVMVHIDSRFAGVSVPDHLMNNPSLTLKLSYNFQGATSYDKDGIEAYLRFSGNYFCCKIPWGAIWGFTSVSGEQKLWAQDMPEEVIRQLQKLNQNFSTNEQTQTNSTQQNEQTKCSSEQIPPRQRPKLTRIK